MKTIKTLTALLISRKRTCYLLTLLYSVFILVISVACKERTAKESFRTGNVDV